MRKESLLMRRKLIQYNMNSSLNEISTNTDEKQSNTVAGGGSTSKPIFSGIERSANESFY